MGKINANHSDSVENRRKLRILVAPLDWGLGHATRCIPIIKHLISLDITVFIGGAGAQEHLLRTEFPELPFLALPGYNMKYARTGAGLPFRILSQLPRVFSTVRQEHKWLMQAVEENSLDAVISDNRYGLHHPRVPTVFITHQLAIKSGLGGAIDRIVRGLNYKAIRRFNYCWIADQPSGEGLAGHLSHPAKLPATTCVYIGPLSRFELRETTVKPGRLLVILSGPEPQRTLFENIVVRQIAHYHGTATIVRGLPGEDKMIPSTNDLTFYNHLPAELLNDEMLKADMVISRSGYSTIMDLVQLRKKSILVPTPGQAEQEYLAAHMSSIKKAIISDQRDFNLIRSLLLAKGYPYQLGEEGSSALMKKAVEEFVAHVGGRNQAPALG